MNPVRTPSVVIGSLNLDYSVIGGRLPQPGETVVGGDLLIAPGGKGCNQAVAMARLGASVAIVGRVGRDDAGLHLAAALDDAGVVTDPLVMDGEAPTGAALIFVDESGQNSIMVAPGANRRLTPADLEASRDLIAAAPVVVLQLEIPLETVECGMSMATGTVILNPAPAVSGAGRLIRSAEIVVPNRGELATLIDELPARSIGEVVDQAGRIEGPAAVVVTLGSEGAVIVRDGRAEHVAAEPVIPVDTTGAGDAFVGALAVAIGEGRDLGWSVRFASRAAGRAVSRRGAQAALATREELE